MGDDDGGEGDREGVAKKKVTGDAGPRRRTATRDRERRGNMALESLLDINVSAA